MSLDITLLTKIHIDKAMVLPVVMHRCEGWTIKKAEHWRIDAFKLWCWRKLLRVPWTAGRSNQSILKDINPEYSLEGLMLKLQLQYFGLLIGRVDSLEKTLMMGKFEGSGGSGENRMRWLGGITDSVDTQQTLGGGEGQRSPMMGSQSQIWRQVNRNNNNPNSQSFYIKSEASSFRALVWFALNGTLVTPHILGNIKEPFLHFAHYLI